MDKEIQRKCGNVCSQAAATAIFVAVLTLITFIIAFFTPPISGPACQENCIDYPYLDIISRFPRDYIWMFPAMLLTLGYMALIGGIHQTVAAERKFFSLIGLSCAILSTGILIVDYFVQIAIIQPSLLMGETEGIALWTQYNPHGIFIALEEAGYILMSFSFAGMALALNRSFKEEITVRWIFWVNFLLTVIACSYVILTSGILRGYTLEIILISIDWLTLIVAAIPLARWFKQRAKQN